MQEWVDVVDLDDKIISKDTKKNCHKEGKWHRCSAIYVIHDDKVLIQVRADNKKVDPSKMDHSAAGHVSSGETYLQGAERELEEELGFNSELTEIGKAKQDFVYGKRIVKHIFTIYTCTYSGEFKLQEEEIKEVKWISVEEINKMVEANSEQFADGFLQTWPVFLKSSEL